MEHRLLLGGEQFLPFARSRIKALRATGLPYADQSFEIDGVSIKVRIEPGHEYIRLEGGGLAYMESGQLEWTFPGIENPTRAKQANWNFLDIPTTDKWLGLVQTSKTGTLGAQVKGQGLSEGMASQAIGWPKGGGSTPEQTAAIDAALEKEYEERTLAKKIAAGFFPASVFSGKLRLFIQAQFGAKAKLTGAFGFASELMGSEPALTYRGRAGASVLFSVYEGNSPGLFTSSDGKYWLITITSTAPGEFVATSYAIRHGYSARNLLAKLRDGVSPPSENERTKLEAYIFADSEIDTENPVVIGSFVGAPGSAMAYGWKWKSDGSEAKIVVQKVLGVGLGDMRWQSSTNTVQFSCVPKSDTAPARITLSSTTETHGEWTDGWGYFNIFVPYLVMLPAPLEHYSLSSNVVAVKPSFTFPSTTIYGFYSKDVWTPVKVSRTLPPSGTVYPIRKSKIGGPVYISPSIPEEREDRIAYGVCAASASTTYEEHRLTQFVSMDVEVGEKIYKGEIRTGWHRKFSRSVSGNGSAVSPGNFTALGVGMTTGFDGSVVLPALDFPVGDTTPYTATAQLGTVTADDLSWTGIDIDRWTLVIPGWDSEAAYVATKGTADDIYNVVHNATTATIVTGFSGSSFVYGNPSPVPYAYEPWTQSNSTHSTGYGAPSQTDMVTVYDSVYNVESYLHVFCYNQELRGTEGTPSGSYSQIFDVDRNYAVFDRGMYTYTTPGGRYILSEGLKMPSSALFNHRFVGWA